jgi:phosphate:Na+ symporter
MSSFNTIIAIVATISLFLFSLGSFSKELQAVGSEKLKNWLSRVTANRFSGFLLGAILTALIQSSSAVSSITVSLVDTGIIGFYNSLSVLIGSNLGTTFTAWLIAFKLNNLGSWLIVLGTLISILPFRINLAGKSIFYLGLILFSLQEISQALEPVSSSAEIVAWLSKANNIPFGIMAGILVTAIVQSSSVTTGLTIILAGQGMLDLQGAIAIVVGCNLGTTSTALLASISMSPTAKKTALANLIFNFLGLLLFMPFITSLTRLILLMDLEITYQVAMAHLLFNLTVSVLALPFLTPLGKLVEGIPSWRTPKIFVK